MAVNMTIDLAEATYADLVALVEAARVAGVAPDAKLVLDGETLTLQVEPGAKLAKEVPEAEAAAHRSLPPLGDAAIRSVVDILTGRQEPPRH
ncbi:hypothetical protein [Corynebacterium sp. HMSC29G08]|uniref:hypothetical protein n=1 Tax=Corynebacterium sp. HMSC29G08 TaxID=1581069 RepID=UPI0008A299A3|nr:hypothetical protein [Corynebacterium sp. HMSC29G08]OFT83662.1 hypothetical protein HMPREF3101_05315 [Corynebacterium sp. HMSC29G08]